MWPCSRAIVSLKFIRSNRIISLKYDRNLTSFCFRTGQILQKIDIPTSKVTSVAFGGPNLDILYVTTASIVFQSTEIEPHPAGSLFKVTGLGVKGTRMYDVDLKQ